MMIKGIPATEAYRLAPEQWVNIYQLSLTGGAEFYDCCKIKDLDLDDPCKYGLELIDEQGRVISQGETVK
jgi:hypothetical protein